MEKALPRLCLLIVLLAPALSACTKAHAKTEPEMPALEMPLPPPRVISPADVQPIPAAAAPAGDEAPARPHARPPSRPTVRNDGARPTESKAEPKPEVPVEMARPESTESSPQLRTLQPGADAAIERTIKDRLSRAAGDLNQVDYGALGENARAQYDTAKRFIQQANDAVRVKNYIFAESLADKAAVLASILLGR